MSGNLGMSFCGLLFTILMAIVFFNQKRINKLENTIYSFLILVTLFELVFGILSYYSIQCIKTYPILNLIINKIYLITLGEWALFFALYVVTISIDISQSNRSNILKTIFISIVFIMAILIISSSLTFYNKNGYVYSSGFATTVTYIVGILSTITVIFCVIKNYRHLLNKKYIPTFVFIFLGALFMGIQILNPKLFLVSPLEVFITFLMYFTIENPDVRTIEELTKARAVAEKSVDEKSQFVFLVTDQMKDVMDRINNYCDDSLSQNINDNVKNNTLEIKRLVESSKININEMLNVSNIDVMNLKITKNKYDFYLLINEIKLLVKNQIPEAVDLRVNLGDNIPAVLYGDSLKLKQVIITLLNNSIKYTNTGFIELRIAGIIKYNVCRLIITVEDSGSGMDPTTINYLLEDKSDLNDDDLDKNTSNNLNLKLVKKIIHLTGGVMSIDSTIGKGTSIKLVMDQGIATSEETSNLDKYANEMLQKTKAAIISEDDKTCKSINSILRKNDIITEIFSVTKDCLDSVRNDILYDVIIIDENMDKIDAKKMYSKLKAEPRFKGKVFVITRIKDFIHKKELLDFGFDEVISNPLDKKSFEEKVKRIKK